MKLSDVTVLVEHHRGADVGRSRLGKALVVIIGGLLSLAVLGAITFVVVYFSQLVDFHQLSELEYLDSRQREELAELELHLEELLARAEEFEPVNDTLRLYHGFDPGLGEGVGIGGPELGQALAAGNRFQVDLLHAGAVIDRQRNQLSELVRLNEQRNDYLKHLPSLNPLPYAHNCSGFGYRRSPITGGTEFHNGVDLVPRGNGKIVAAADGVVVVARAAGAYGLLIRIDHGYGYQTRYGHCRNLYVKPGDHVRRGEVIALVGCTGRATGTHLHYEVLHNGINVDPELYILGDQDPIQTARQFTFTPTKEEENQAVLEEGPLELEISDDFNSGDLDMTNIEHEMNPAEDDPLHFGDVKLDHAAADEP